MNNLRIFLFFIFGTFLLSNCNPKTAAEGNLKKVSEKVLLQKMVENQQQFERFNAKIKATYASDKETFNATLTVRLRKDSLIWISGSKFTIEGVRMLITPDSVHILNRLDRTYAATDFTFLSQNFNLPASFDALQHFLLGNALTLTNPTYRADLKETQHQLIALQSPLRLTYHLSGLDFSLENLLLEDLEQKRELYAQYSDYQPIEGRKQSFSFLRVLEMNSAETGKITVDLLFSKVEFDQAAEMPFSIPSNYKHIQP